MSKDYEKLANEFLGKLTGGEQKLCSAILQENPEILDTAKFAKIISPDRSRRTPSPDSYNLSFHLINTLCEYRRAGIISDTQFKKTINKPSPETGETIFTSILKETLRAAQNIEKTSDDFEQLFAMKTFNDFISKLRILIDQNGSIQADANVPNLRGQYPLELVQSINDDGRLRNLLSTEIDCIKMATNPAVLSRIKHGLTGKSNIEITNDENLPKITALLVDIRVDPNNPKNDIYMKYSTPTDVSVLKTDKPTFLSSDVYDPLSIARIHEPGKYILQYYPDSQQLSYNINKLNNWHERNFYLRNSNRWNAVPQDKIFDTVTALCKKSKDSNVNE